MMTLSQAEMKSEIVKALAHPIRLSIIYFLEDGEKGFSSIVDCFEYDKSTISKHLSILKSAGLIDSTKSGTEKNFFLEVPCVINFLNCVSDVIEKKMKKCQMCLCGHSDESEGEQAK